MITTGTRRHDLVGNGTAGPFTYQFMIPDKNYLLVYVDGNLKTVDTHYTVTGVGNEDGGTITFTTGNEPASSADIILLGSEPYTQSAAFQEAASLPAATLEGVLDKHVRLTAQLNERLNRAPVMDVTDHYGKPPIRLEGPFVAGQFLRVDSLAQNIEGATPTTTPSGLPVGGNYDHLTINGSGAVAWAQQVYNFSANYLNISKYASLSAAVAAIGSTVATLLISTQQTVAGDVTVPSTLTLQFVGQGSLLINGGATVTMNGTIVAPLSKQIFSGTGSIAGTFKNDSVSVKWWGATGDGATDDTTPIQNALNAGANLTIYFPPGTYKTANLIVSYNYQRIVGAGWSSVIWCKDANAALLSLQDGLIGTEIAYLKMRDTGTFNVTYRGRSLVYCNPSGLSTGVSKINVHHCWLANGAISGISGNKILDSHFHHNVVDADGGAIGEHGIYCSSQSKRVTIDHNIMRNVGTSNGAGITSNTTDADNSVTDITADANIIQGFQYGIQPAATSNFVQSRWVITNNILIGTSDSTKSGIDLFSVKLTNSVISNNIVTGFTEHGFRNDFLFDSVVANNIFANNKQCGMILRGTQRNLFSGNLFRDNDIDSNGTSGDDSSGLRLLNTGTTTGNVFTGNVANVSVPASYQKWGISTGTGVVGNYFLNNVATPNRTADLDVTGATGNYWVHMAAGVYSFGDLGGSANVDYANLVNALGQITPGGQAAKILAGSGTPETFVTAPVGSIFLRTNGGAGTSIYVKESGAGNTGWVGK